MKNQKTRSKNTEVLHNQTAQKVASSAIANAEQIMNQIISIIKISIIRLYIPGFIQINMHILRISKK